MKKQFIYFFFLSVFIASGYCQTLVFSDDFESYTAGSLLVQTSTHPEWMTWTQPYGAGDDVTVSDLQASQGLNSIQVLTNKDIVLHLGDKTTGRYQILFDLFVSSGSAAYFNLLNDFNGNNSVWGFQAFFNANGTGTADADGADAATFTFTSGTWNSISIIVDVDDDFATFYLNGSEVVSWTFSKGAQGGGTLQKLDAVNFFGYTNNNYFIDDIMVYEQPSMTGPMNLLATLNGNDVDLVWDAPSGPTPDSYVVLANNSVIATGVSGTTYTHMNPYPGDYTYNVKAHYNGLGYSLTSNDATVNIAGGVTRSFVLIEKGTGTWCQFCPGAAMGLEQLFNEGHDVAIIAYHSGDSYEVPDCNVRLDYYNITGYPSVVFDGGNLMSGGSATQNLYPAYKPVFDQKIIIPSLHNIDLQVEQTGIGTFTASIEVEQQSDYYTGDFKLYGAVTESSILENWQNQTHLDFVFRKMYPSANGQTVNFSGSSAFSTTMDFDIQNNWVKDNCEFIVFLQYPATKDVIQTAKVDMSTVISVEEFETASVVVRPNPATEFVSVYSKDMETVHIHTLTGQTVLSKIAEGNEIHIDIRQLPAGIYLIQTRASGSVNTSKLVIQ
jgi:hypothetical protein